jgi:Peptidase family M28
MAISNPFAFTRGPVTLVTTVVYTIIVVVLIVIQTSVPAPPTTSTPVAGINLTEAWHDLQLLTTSYHPYNSHRNDDVRDWLLLRVKSILAENGVSSNTTDANTAAAYIFSDTSCNITSSVIYGSTRPSSVGGISAYFESTNIIVYIRGREDDKTQWWMDANGKPTSRNVVLVNAHYDSVSTGFGATDDGVGVISVLQLLKYYTTPGHTPKNGLVLLLNNGEEDFLNGARAFSQHPMSKLVSTFLNLEGAGAGGRAILFRSTDAEITKAYSKSPHPFGSVVTGDGFERGLVRSQTDYIVFNGVLGYRGLDVAFFEPRARYHTSSDDTRHTSKGSLWHMLSAAISTTRELTASSIGSQNDSPGVWFDLFGKVFAVFQLHTLFALSVTLLVVAPIILAVTMVALYSADKLYLFSSSREYHTRDGYEAVLLYGLRGFFRTPLILLVACAAPVALAYLLFKENTFIAHSSEWAVWSMMLSSFLFVAWFFSRVADYARPSALTRAYSLTWLFIGWWAFLVAGTVFETQYQMAGVYFVFFYFASVFLATWVSYLELFSLPKKSKFCSGKFEEIEDIRSRSHSGSRVRDNHSPPARGSEHHDEDNEEATERSGLLPRGRSTFKNYTHPEDDDAGSTPSKVEEKHHVEEQEWSKPQWNWLWVLQLLIIAPVNLIFVGQISLITVTSLHQTGSDGSSMFLVYIFMAISSILLLSPIIPFVHRFTWHIPIFLLLVLIGTTIYSLVAFPFSPNNKLKLYFQQEVDIDNGTNTVSFTGITPFVQDAISTLPSAAGQHLNCTLTDSTLEKCSWLGLPPKIADPQSKLPPEELYRTWVQYNVSRIDLDGLKSLSRFMLYGRDTRACKLVFDSPVSDFHVHGAAPVDKRFPPVPQSGSKEIRLWSRTWDRIWTVDVQWEGTSDLTGKVVCLWSDVNEAGVIPAFDEARHFVPEWIAVTKAGDGLVEGFRRFSV